MLAVGAKRSATGHPLFVAGPQVGYFYPEYFLELDLHGGGFDVRGARLPGIPLVVIGRGKDFALERDQLGRATSSTSTSRRSAAATGSTTSTRAVPRDGHVRRRHASTTGRASSELVFHTTVHGPVVAYATSNGQPVAISTRRSLARARAALRARLLPARHERRLVAAELRAGDGRRRVHLQLDVRRQHGTSRTSRARGCRCGPRTSTSACRRAAPATTSGAASCRSPAHPHGVDPASGLIVNWNNKPAPGFSAADDNWSYGRCSACSCCRARLATAEEAHARVASSAR